MGPTYIRWHVEGGELDGQGNDELEHTRSIADHALKTATGQLNSYTVHSWEELAEYVAACDGKLMWEEYDGEETGG